jgi:hypothetical protein
MIDDTKEDRERRWRSLKEEIAAQSHIWRKKRAEETRKSNGGKQGGGHILNFLSEADRISFVHAQQ